MKERIVNLETLDFETSQEVSLRPNLWEDFIGQEKIKSNLQISICAAKKRQESLDHMLFFGPPGLGKTSISHIIAKEMETNIKITAAPMIEKSGDLAAILTNLQAKDILFIDEIHRLSPAIEEVLYPAMEDFRLDIIIGSGPAAQTIKIDLPPFTLIGATTRAGMLSNPLRDRFGMSFRMQFYSPSELALIIKKAATKLNQDIKEESADEIAKRSRGTPRIALRLLKRVRDFALVKNSSLMDLNITLHALNELGVNELGFDEADLAYLSLLANAQGRPVGLNTIAASMREDEGTIEDVIEPFLLANGYLERTAKGRIATPKTHALLKIPPLNPQTLF
ncbi:Holliday junction branch migration DNA helicase RuvB [Helicobacter pylori]|uniref:Holliday junction branch migration DNA helicase RuvB n=1 Tax=Helicobacter pylori TaxID=210 RepID=UPI00165B4448|nr:Holliday junction branch migration DNA helicase RuvB [Helicobacter pylori]MBH0235288.1 Holliday junction branch migration DNA helicase RuvB [Helicobacter pylori]MBH0252043.1 Holliday junction branch migration DNA helicase RuvB [Helicobacter pylori]MBH0270119.1 Holliday junction branch migration DNA helicase RuvB [Helicobacter pylori]WQS47645.1 Holliday junction branch migration DNA helicase RuvB [Helicobacter pylori]WQW52703.1 Holliday junction branch migration DNA helicase RuvB [Helicobact